MGETTSETNTAEAERAIVAARLKESREYLGLSQQEVADELKLPRTAVSLIETGQRRVDTLELKAFAKLYQRSVAHFTGEDVGGYEADVVMLAKKVAGLSEQDRDEVLRFSEFLTQRARARGKDGEPS
jgi:transcriptional regulator with XRE-family HTH domain